MSNFVVNLPKHKRDDHWRIVNQLGCLAQEGIPRLRNAVEIAIQLEISAFANSER